MKRYDNIMQDNINPPQTDNNIWLKDNNLYYYKNGKWVLIGSGISNIPDDLENRIKDLEERLEGQIDGEHLWYEA